MLGCDKYEIWNDISLKDILVQLVYKSCDQVDNIFSDLVDVLSEIKTTVHDNINYYDIYDVKWYLNLAS